MKSKRMIVVVVSSIVLCLSLFFIFQNETDTSTSKKDLTLIYEEKVSPNKEYVYHKDTFNKLGYKTKINTHITSCINLFLDIYLYSEYRLIYC